MPKLTYAENPVHPVLNDYPAVLASSSLVFDMLHLFTRRPTFKNASFFTLLLSLLTAGPAAYTGFQDYREMPAGTPAKRLANAHGMLNVGLMGATAVNVLIRMTGRVGLFARLLNLGTNVGLMASGWYGTHLVYRHGMRVHGVDPLAEVPGPAGDPGKAIAERLEQFAAGLPDTDMSDYAFQATDMATQASRQAQTALEGATTEVSARVEEVRAKAQSKMGESGGDMSTNGGDVSTFAPDPSFAGDTTLSGDTTPSGDVPGSGTTV